MTIFRIVPALVLAVSACTTTSETRTPATLEGGFLDGERYEIRTRLIEGPEGAFEQTSVVYRGLARPCVPDSPNDCESVARGLIEDYDDLVF